MTVEQTNPTTPHPSPARTWLLPYALLYGVLACALILTLWQIHDKPVLLNDSSEIISKDGCARQNLSGRIDPNTAEWHELSLLPELGKTVAQQIVAYRRAHQIDWQQSHSDRSPAEAPPVFATAEDLLPIKGIGPKTLEKIRPYLQFPQSQPAATQPH